MKLAEKIYRLTLTKCNGWTEEEANKPSLKEFEDDELYLNIQYLILNHKEILK